MGIYAAAFRINYFLLRRDVEASSAERGGHFSRQSIVCWISLRIPEALRIQADPRRSACRVTLSLLSNGANGTIPKGHDQAKTKPKKSKN